MALCGRRHSRQGASHVRRGPYLTGVDGRTEKLFHGSLLLALSAT